MRRFFDALVRYIRDADIFLMILCLISSIYGIILISSVTRNMSSARNDVYIQTVALLLGLVLYVLFSYIDIDTVADKSVVLLIASALFISTLFFWGVGAEETGNKAWLRFAGFGVQPAEIVKIVYIIIIAKMIVDYRDRKALNHALSVLKILLVFGLLFGLILLSSADMGSALIYLFILAVMLYIGGLKLRWFALGAVLIGAVSPVVWFFVLNERYRDRIRAPFNPSVDPDGLDIMWQANRSKEAIASGGFPGQGLFRGRMTQSGAVPAQRTDFIFSAAGEELGFVGCMLIILLLTVIIIRCVYVGVKSNSTLGLLVCTGIATMFIVQMAENIGMCLGLTPVIGITLPFFSAGGSSIVTNMAAVGIVSGIKMRPKPARFRNM